VVVVVAREPVADLPDAVELQDVAHVLDGVPDRQRPVPLGPERLLLGPGDQDVGVDQHRQEEGRDHDDQCPPGGLDARDAVVGLGGRPPRRTAAGGAGGGLGFVARAGVGIGVEILGGARVDVGVGVEVGVGVDVGVGGRLGSGARGGGMGPGHGPAVPPRGAGPGAEPGQVLGNRRVVAGPAGRDVGRGAHQNRK
jgi:hypothetical protein